jgi:hypothetical protein
MELAGGNAHFRSPTSAETLMQTLSVPIAFGLSLMLGVALTSAVVMHCPFTEFGFSCVF